MLIELIYFILISFGITKVLVWGSILNKIRPDIPPFNCAMCMGWWIGLGLFIISPYTLLFSFQYNIINAIMMAFLSSGTSYILDNIIDDKGIRIEYSNTTNKDD